MSVSALRAVSLSAAALAVCLTAPAAFAAETTQPASDYTYTVAVDGTAVITAYNGKDSTLTIPNALDGHDVTKIGDNAFAYNQQITSVTLPNGVTEIGSYAFNDCTQLVSVKVPANLAAVGEGAFFSCTSLTEAPLPDGLKSLGESAFYNCVSLQSVTVPGTVQTFGSHVFADCTALTTAVLGEGLTAMPVQAFRGCTALTNVTLPTSLTEIGDRAFFDCASLTQITLPKSLNKIGDYAFRRTALNSIALTKGTVGKGAFADSGALASIDFGAVTSIGDEAFRNTALTKVPLPASLTSLGSHVFTVQSIDEPQQVTYTVAEGNTAFCTDNQGALYDASCTTLLAVPSQYTGAFAVPNTVTAIAPYAFENCAGLTAVTLPLSLVQIGESAFRGCTSLTAVTLPDGVRALPAYAFYNCSSLSSVTLPAGLTDIADYAFAKCSSLTQLKLPATLTQLTGAAFTGCGKIQFTCDANGALQTSTNDASLLLADNGTTLAAWACGNAVTDLTVPDTVTNLAAHAIVSPSVTTVTLSANVTNIASEAIGYSLSEVTGEMSRTEDFAIYAPESAQAAYTYAKANELGCFTGKPQPAQTSCTLTAGETYSFTVQNSPASMTVYASSDNQVATVAQDGTITAIANGTADIFAMNGQRYSKLSVTVTGGTQAKAPYDGYRMFDSEDAINGWYQQYAAVNSNFSLEKTDNPNIRNYTSNNYPYIWACQPDGTAFAPAAEAEYGDDYRQFRTVGKNLRWEAARYTLSDNIVTFSGDSDLSALTGKTTALADILGSVGKTYTPKLFTSTSLLHEVSHNFATGYRRYVLEFYLPKGSQAAYIEPITVSEGEQEVFLNDGVSFTIADAGVRLCGDKPECYVRLVAEGSTPTPSPTPTATPEPTATPAPTATPSPTPTAAPTNTPAPTATAAPTATPAPTAAPTAVPTATPQPTPDDSKFYTCPKCGYHNWTAVAGGYRCDHCGNVVTKQLADYPNVKGRTDDAALTATAAPAATKAPATVSDPSASVVNRTPAPTEEPTPTPTAAPTPSPAPEATPEATPAPTEAPQEEPTAGLPGWLRVLLIVAVLAIVGGVIVFRFVLPKNGKDTYRRS